MREKRRYRRGLHQPFSRTAATTLLTAASSVVFQLNSGGRNVPPMNTRVLRNVMRLSTPERVGLRVAAGYLLFVNWLYLVELGI